MADEALKGLILWLKAECTLYHHRAEQSYSEYLGGRERLRDRADWLQVRIQYLESDLSELARLRAEREWREISTAPWSGPPVLLWKPSTSEHYVAARIRGEHGPGWCTPDGYEIFRATHWQPLPAPPVQSHEEKQG